jgi:hypothetical protein
MSKVKKRIIVTGLIIAVIHFVIAVGSVAFALGSAMEGLHKSDYSPTVLEDIAALTAAVLLQPLLSVWPLINRYIPNVIEWILAGCNSLLWGFAIALLMNVQVSITRTKPA